MFDKKCNVCNQEIKGIKIGMSAETFTDKKFDYENICSKCFFEIMQEVKKEMV